MGDLIFSPNFASHKKDSKSKRYLTFLFPEFFRSHGEGVKVALFQPGIGGLPARWATITGAGGGIFTVVPGYSKVVLRWMYCA